MKLFGNTSVKGRQSAPRPRAEDNPRVSTVELRSETVSVAAKKQKKDRFVKVYLICVLCVLLIIAAGLLLLWRRMDVYERSRPARAVEAWIDATDSAGWRTLLSGMGVEDSYLSGLDLADAEYYKKLELYTDETPTFGVRFGKKTMLVASLKRGEALGFGSNAWEIGSVSLADSGFTVYAPVGAAVTVDGAPVPEDSLVQRDAQPLTLGVFEQGRDDIPGLSKYVLNDVFGVERVQVTDAEGNALSPAYSSGVSWYYPPLTSDYTVIAPAAAAVTVNGVTVTEENAASCRERGENDAYRIFDGIEDSLPFSLEAADRRIWTVEGLVARPAVAAVLSDGTALAAVNETNNTWEFEDVPVGAPDAALAAELEEYILNVFDAHIAYLGNRAGNFEGNYGRYTAYLVPGSEAAEQARRARESVVWAKGQNTHPTAVVKEVLRYAEDCFTAQVDFTPENDPDGDVNSNIFVFVRYNGEWRVVRVMNQ